MSAPYAAAKIGESGTTYKRDTDDTRYALALAYLSVPRHSVSESLICWVLGGQLLYARVSSLDRPLTLRLARGCETVCLGRDDCKTRRRPNRPRRQLKVQRRSNSIGERMSSVSLSPAKNLSRPCRREPQ